MVALSFAVIRFNNPWVSAEKESNFYFSIEQLPIISFFFHKAESIYGLNKNATDKASDIAVSIKKTKLHYVKDFF